MTFTCTYRDYRDYRGYRDYRDYRDYLALFRGPKLGDCRETTSTRAAGCGVCTRGMVERMG